MKTVAIITDVWASKPINGVVTTLWNIKKALEGHGFKVMVIHPGLFRSLPLPTYPEIKLAILAKRKLKRLLESIQPDFVHIASEGPLGFAARNVCLRKKWKFTTFYHTRLPEYVQVRLGAFRNLTYSYLRYFHKRSACTMVSTHSLKQELEQRGFSNLEVIPLGVDTHLFKPDPSQKAPMGMKKPVFVYLGRVAPEKNIEAFLDCDLPGSKLVIGEGPILGELRKKYRGKATFAGFKPGKELVDLLTGCDVFVFPSKTDTLSLAIMEALACGLPVAAYNVQGPNNIIENGKDGFLGEDLESNAKKCLSLNRDDCVKKAQSYSWGHTAKAFIKHLIPI